MSRTLSPSGAPIQFGDLLSGFKAELVPGDDSIEIFTKQIEEYTGCEDIFLLSSGKAALSITLNALSTISNRREVIIPAYSSFCLASVLAASGLSVKLCDIDIQFLDFDLNHLSKLVNEKTLAVIPVHLFGLVARLDEIMEITKSKGAFLVEDAAQSAGAKYNGECVGTIGDAGIFSLGRGKSISTIHGGVIVSRNKTLADIIGKNIQKLPRLKILGRLKMLFSAIAIIFFLRPRFYFIPASLPFLKLGANEYEPDFKLFRFSNLQAGIGRKNFRRLDFYNKKRTENALYLAKSLKDINNIILPKIASKSIPCFTRFPLYCSDKQQRDHKYADLTSARLGVSKNFPSPLNEISGFKDLILNSNDSFSNSKKICERLLTLPTHPFVEKEDLMNMICKLI